MRRGEVWWVRFDRAEGHEMRKSRPAIIVQNDLGNEYSPTTIVATITSKISTRAYPFEVLVFQEKIKGTALLNHIYTVDKGRLIRWIEKLSPGVMADVDNAMRLSLGLS